MFCPKCKYEYIEKIKECSRCKTLLVEKLPPDKKNLEPQYIELVTVFAAMDPGLVAVAKSILEGSGIRYFAKGENLQNIFGNTISGAVEIQVDKDDFEDARILLKELR